MSARKSSHGTIFLIVSSGSPLALIASSLRSTSKKPVCPMTRSLHPPMAHCGQRVRFVATWREEFFKVPKWLNSDWKLGCKRALLPVDFLIIKVLVFRNKRDFVYAAVFVKCNRVQDVYCGIVCTG